MVTTILGIVAGFLAAIPIIYKYFPPKTPEQKKEDLSKKVDDEESQAMKTGRPS